jgi:putative Mg2+ transporter-C (MgtC) family protein
MADTLSQLVRSPPMELLIQLALAVVLGGVIGLERELSGKPAGLRTNVLICAGATFFTVLSLQIAGDRGDPARVAAQILTGIGFIGAGTILHTRGAVTGLTSAATIWMVTAIGMAVGSKAYLEAVGATALVIVVLMGLVRADRLIARRGVRSHLVVHATPKPNLVEELESLVQAAGLEVERSSTRREYVDAVVDLDLRGPRRGHEQALVAVIHHAGVRSVSTGE